MKHVDQLPGGRADRKTPHDFDAVALAEGTEHELEHTKDRNLAREIAMDHLAEDPKYYDKLRAIEQKKLSKSEGSMLSKGLNDYGKDWFEQYRGTPFFAEAIELEQQHVRHELDRKAKRKENEKLRAERDRLLAEQMKGKQKEESIWDWDDRFYATHDAKVAGLRGKYLEWLKTMEAKRAKELGKGADLLAVQERLEKSDTAYMVALRAEGVRESRPDPTTGASIQETTMPTPTTSDLFKSVRDRDIRKELAVLAKGDFIEHTRPGEHKEGMPSAGDVVNPNPIAPSMVDHPRPAAAAPTAKSTDVKDGKEKKPESEERIRCVEDDMDDAKIAKSLDTWAYHQGEQLTGAIPHASGELPGSAAGPGIGTAHEITPENNSVGIPNAGGIEEHILSADDPPSQMSTSNREHPAYHLSTQNGANGLAPTINAQISPSGGLAKGQPGSSPVFESPWWASPRDMSPTAGILADRPPHIPQASGPRPDYFRRGELVFSNVADKEMEKAFTVGHGDGPFGGFLGGVTFGAYDERAPLLRQAECQACHKSMPAYLSVCTTCGHDHATGRHIAVGAMAKAIQNLMATPIREPDYHMPFGIPLGPEDR